MIIDADSCLRRIPVVLDRKQAFFIEGVRVSIEMIDLVYSRLEQTLITVTKAFIEKNRIEPGILTLATSDAWLIVDAYHRLADLARHFPRVVHRNRIPSFRHLEEGNGVVNELRNVVQHLPEQINGLPVGPSWSVWGVLSWRVPPETVGGVIRCCSYLAGNITAGTRPMFKSGGCGKSQAGWANYLVPRTSLRLLDGFVWIC